MDDAFSAASDARPLFLELWNHPGPHIRIERRSAGLMADAFITFPSRDAAIFAAVPQH